MTGERALDRQVFAIAGADRKEFLQGLITNDIDRLDHGLVYAALLSPQGKYLADFFLLQSGETILLDITSTLAQATIARLSMYRLRAKVQIEPTDLVVIRGLGTAPEDAFPDPRHPDLGWRRYGHDQGGTPEVDWDAIRVAHCIPESGVELVPDESYILEAGFERLNGVDFRKGCYVGQEVTARMKHKTELRKGLIRVRIDGSVPPGTEVLADGKPAGRVFTQASGEAIAYLRFDRVGNEMRALEARISVV